MQAYHVRDACATLQLVLLSRNAHTPEQSSQRDAVADYVEECGASSSVPDVTLVCCAASVSPACCVCVGVSTCTGKSVCVVLPSYAAYFFDYTMEWAFIVHAEMSRQYVGRCLIAKLQTVGGGWASLHRADRALLCALQLHTVAEAVFDEEVVRKCRLFIGWAHLWNSDPAKALAVFRRELKDARARSDIVHERRCRNAICNAKKNPRLAPGGEYTDHFDLVSCWADAFA